MASLTHVKIWSEHGWQSITAEEASRMHPGGTVSARSGLFMCDLCNQYVTLTDGEQRVRYFRHSAYEDSKDCPERTFGAGYTPTALPGAHELPLRLTGIQTRSFSLEVGMLYVPADILAEQEQQYFSVIPVNSGVSSYRYSFDRLNENGITYVPIGSEPANQYRIICTPKLRTFWPESVKGIAAKGSLFHCTNGKMLPENSDVQLGRKYNLLTRYSLYIEYPGIAYKLLTRAPSGWLIYEIEPTGMTEDAAKFFLERHYRLTDSPISIQPVWPLYVEGAYVIKHNADALYFHIRGNSDVSSKVFPESNVDSYRNRISGAQLVKVKTLGRQQMISAGRFARTADYLYFWREDLNAMQATKQLSQKDWSGAEIPGGEQSQLPEKGILQITLPFDGTAEMWKHEKLVEKRSISANNEVVLDNISYDTRIVILQGFDVVWEGSFVKPKNQSSSVTDEQLLQKLIQCRGTPIPIYHSAGAIAEKLNGKPRTKAWLRNAIRNGEISSEAYEILKSFVIQK